MQKCTREKNREDHLRNLLGQNTDVGGAQAQPPAHNAKAVPRRAGPGAAAPRVRAHRPHLLLAPPCTGGALMTLGVVLG